MKASELIKQLQKAVKIKGDVDVIIDITFEGMSGEINKVDLDSRNLNYINLESHKKHY